MMTAAIVPFDRWESVLREPEVVEYSDNSSIGNEIRWAGLDLVRSSAWSTGRINMDEVSQ